MNRSILLSCLLVSLSIRAQEKENFYVFNSREEPTNIDSAKFLMRVLYLNDTCWQWDYYNFFGPLISSEQFIDKKGTALHGEVRYYNPQGCLDSMGTMRNGKKHGDFYKLFPRSDSLKFQTWYKFEDDKLVGQEDIQTAHKNDEGLDEKESEYPGGKTSWSKFLTKNLVYPERAIGANMQGTVRVLFEVGVDGRVKNASIGKSVEYSIDKESLRMIKISGKWSPGFKNGLPVKTYKLQPITYQLSGQ
jgi:periplasmic protein TonB